jgi:PAS domain S-box-containing protein
MNVYKNKFIPFYYFKNIITFGNELTFKPYSIDMRFSPDYLESFFYRSPAGIGLMNSRIFEFVNDRLANLCGYSKKGLTGKHMGILYPNERESKKTERMFYPALEEKGIATIETKWRTKDHQIIDVFLGGMLLDPENFLEYSEHPRKIILLMVFDVTERKRTEVALRKGEISLKSLLEKNKACFWDWNVTNNHIYFSQQWMEMLGYMAEEDDSNINWLEQLIHLNDRNRVLKIMNNRLWGENPAYETEYRLRSKSESWVWVFDRGKVYEEEDNEKTLKLISRQTDITPLKRKQQNLAHPDAEVQEKAETTIPCHSDISPEKTTPDMGMTAFYNVLLTPSISKRNKQRYFEMMMDAGSRNHEFIENMVILSKLSANRLKAEKNEFNVNILIRNLCRRFSSSEEYKDTDLKCYTPYLDNCCLYTDKEKLHKILRYLLLNAFLHNRKGKTALGYQLVEDEMRFFVKDSGEGLSYSASKKIFEPFSTLWTDSNSQITSLRLTVAKGLAKLLHGDLWVQSEEGEGSIFYLTIPYISEKDKEEGKQVKFEFSSKDLPGSPSTILIVEDDHSNAFFLTEALESIGLGKSRVNIKVVTNGLEAVDYCRNNTVDVVLMDIKLPEMDGLTACRKIKLIQPDLPVIAQTAYAYPEDKERIFSAGCNDYLVKPMSVNLIYEKLRKYLRIRNGDRVSDRK